ncbi:hypothetical protein, partial [Staphylococcus aureus]
QQRGGSNSDRISVIGLQNVNSQWHLPPNDFSYLTRNITLHLVRKAPARKCFPEEILNSFVRDVI